MLEVVELSKRYAGSPRPAVENLSFSIRPGEIVGLVGLNGAGKTTTLRVATGINLASAGDVEVEGHSITQEKAAASRHLGWVPESPIHDSSRGLGRLLDYYTDLSGEPASLSPREALAEWGMDPYERTRFRDLSMGERKRFAMAVASLRSPTYYLLDEVFNGLDPSGVAQVREWMLARRKDHHGLLVSSHQLWELQSVADRFVIVHKGRRVTEFPADQIPVSAQKRLRIVLRPNDDAALALLQPFGEVERTGNGIVLRGKELNGAAINRTLVRAGYDVERLEAATPDLETYFLSLLEENR